MSLFVYERRFNSAFGCWVLDVSRLGISLCLGDIRQGQIFVVWIYCFILNFCFSSTKQISENLWLGQKLVCVVYFGSRWISTFVLMGGWVSFWVLGGIMDSKAKGLKGSLTILTTFAAVCGRLGFDVLWGGTHHGDIRLEIATMIRTLYSTSKLVFYFLDLISGNQSHISWFFSKPVSSFFAESFESDLLGSKGILGSWG
ncbi:hypothetical protein Hanom_Chr16g01478871 [Helianthus anomalus]